jgi:hypothetical protein
MLERGFLTAAAGSLWPPGEKNRRKPTFSQGVEIAGDRSGQVHAFFNTLPRTPCGAVITETVLP